MENHKMVLVGFLMILASIQLNEASSRGRPNKCPMLFEHCPNGSIPSYSRFDPIIGEFQLSCRDSPKFDGDCVHLDDDQQSASFQCPSNHVLVGRDDQRPVCCQLKGACLMDCFIPKVFYSFQIGFEFEIEQGYALVGKYSYGSCADDPSLFRIAICKLMYH